MIRVTASLSPPPPFPVYLLHCTNKAKSYKTDLKKKQKKPNPKALMLFSVVQTGFTIKFHLNYW